MISDDSNNLPPQDNLIFSIDVTLCAPAAFKGKSSGVTMIPFSATTEGKYFTGKSIINGCDTQISEQRGFSLSARYMLTGKDYTGAKCSIFIENNGTSLENCLPKIKTDSEALSFLEKAELYSRVIPSPDGKMVIVKIFSK